MKYLLSVSVGPVQGFIAAARKIRDLYAGSWIVSELAKAAAYNLSSHNLIFPCATGQELQDETFAAVNKVLAEVETDDPRALSLVVKEAAVARLQNIIHGMKTPASLDYEQDRLVAHVEELFEFYAAWVPFTGSENYSEQREAVERLLNARKTLNNFSAHRGVPGRNKSSLDGGRECVIRKRGKSEADVIRLREDEHLDGPGLLKRYLDMRVRFESTTEAAALPYVRKLELMAREDPDLAFHLAALRNLNERAKLPWDSGALLYEYESREAFPENTGSGEDLRRARQAIHKVARPEAPYYALMIADGDSMGSVLNGLTIQQHKQLSRDLSEFSSAVQTRLREMDCMPVFAGGDDVLAVLPLHRLREAAWLVRSEFTRLNAGSKKLTLSAGIAVAHALDPLDEVRERARNAERSAKQVDGKDAVSISVYPRSGAPVAATGKWDDMGDALAEITRAMIAGKLSFGFAHELRGLLDRVGTRYAYLEPILPQMAASIAERKQEGSVAVGLVSKVRNRDELDALTRRMLAARKLAKAERDAGVTGEISTGGISK